MNEQATITPKKRHLHAIMNDGGPLGAVANLSQYSERNGAVLDVGVNRGTIALYLCRLFSDLPIHLIEPIPAQCEYITERFSRFPTVKVHQLALSDRNGTADFHLADHTGSSSLFANEGDLSAQNSKHNTIENFEVEVQTLDTWCENNDVNHISCMKIDAQGAEHSILTGGERMLKSQAVDVIMLEWFATPHYDGVPLMDQIWSRMTEYGYVLYDLFPGRRFPKNGQLRFGDAVFMSHRFRDTCLPKPFGPTE